MGMIVLRVLACAVGLAAVVAFFLSIIRVSLLVRHRQDWLATLVTRVVHGLFRLGLSGTRAYGPRDHALVYEAPVIVIVLIATWFVFVIAGFTGIFWAIEAGSLFRAFVVSGMSLSTLGSVVAETDIGKVTSIAEGGVGLGIVALLITFMPEFYTVVTQREHMVSWLAARVGPVPSPTAIVEWLQRTGQLGRDADVWSSWETWLSDLDETHSSLTILVYFRSFRPGLSWVTTAGAIVDAAALVASTVDGPAGPAVDITLGVGMGALQHIGAAAGVPHASEPVSIDQISVTRAAYDAAFEHLLAAGVPLKADRDRAWQDFAGFRARYDRVLLALTREVEAPQVPWPPS